MFDYPLPLPRHTLYHLLGVDPEAPSEEISEARNEIIRDLTQQKNNLERRLEEMEATVPGLEEARQSANQSGLSEQKLTEAKKALAWLEQQIRKNHPDYHDLKDGCREIAAEINRINQLPILSSDGRLAYDRQTPPLELLKLEPCTRDALAHNHIVLPLLREELSRFLTEQGEEVFQPSDLTRKDFVADFNFHPLLDGEDS